jgi:hypothetical protein
MAVFIQLHVHGVFLPGKYFKEALPITYYIHLQGSINKNY